VEAVAMNPFDQAARYAARRLDAEGFLRWLLPEVFGPWRWLGWLETQANQKLTTDEHR
jgi:hypothetical protein